MAKSIISICERYFETIVRLLDPSERVSEEVKFRSGPFQARPFSEEDHFIISGYAVDR